jgi:hypothetical protein
MTWLWWGESNCKGKSKTQIPFGDDKPEEQRQRQRHEQEQEQEQGKSQYRGLSTASAKSADSGRDDMVVVGESNCRSLCFATG